MTSGAVNNTVEETRQAVTLLVKGLQGLRGLGPRLKTSIKVLGAAEPEFIEEALKGHEGITPGDIARGTKALDDLVNNLPDDTTEAILRLVR